MMAQAPTTETGPRLPARAIVHAQAMELRKLATRAEELSGFGPTADLGAALHQFERMRAILGIGQ